MGMARPLALRLTLACSALLVAAPAAAAQDGGGAVAPEPGATQPATGQPKAGGKTGETGGLRPGDRRARRVVAKRRKARRARSAPRLAEFTLRSTNLFLYGGPGRVSFRVDGRAKSVTVRLYVKPAEGGKAVQTLELGEQTTGETHTADFDPDELEPGRYRLRIAARDRRKRPLRRAAAVASVAEFALYGHHFPLLGAFTYGGVDGRFGAPRSGYSHQGQDLSAAEGTPVVSPHGGVVEVVRYQASGAGHYVVVDAFDDRDYVFMHLRAGSILVEEGQRVRTGEQLGEVGNTGRSFGAHLHFEIWEGGGGWYDGGDPVDPLPYLKSWDRYS